LNSLHIGLDLRAMKGLAVVAESDHHEVAGQDDPSLTLRGRGTRSPPRAN
jgi:hypothetical protein